MPESGAPYHVLSSSTKVKEPGSALLQNTTPACDICVECICYKFEIFSALYCTIRTASLVSTFPSPFTSALSSASASSRSVPVSRLPGKQLHTDNKLHYPVCQILLLLLHNSCRPHPALPGSEKPAATMSSGRSL